MASVRPSTVEAARDALSGATKRSQKVQIVGAGTKLSWGVPAAQADLELDVTGLDRVVEHNAGDLTAVLEGGVPLSRAQEIFAGHGQMLALDPWLGAQGQATVGGILATGDSGPLRHRYGAPRDLVLGMTVVLSDGTVARSGGQVIKNVAGYDLAKLFCGSFGTLGLIASVNVRLHPRPAPTATARGASADPAVLATAALRLAGAPLELEALDFAYQDGRGTVLARCAGADPPARAARVAELMAELGLGSEVIDQDGHLWEDQRTAQRAQSGDVAVVRVVARPSRLGELLELAGSSSARAVGRVALGLSYLQVDPGALSRLLGALPAGSSWTLLDAPEAVRAGMDPWGDALSEPALELMRRVKARFDPAMTCNPGVFVGGM
jgi:glycolate oxidase FAD binding subunit